MTEYVAGPDLDLDREEFVLKDGRRLTNDLAGQLAGETLAEVRAPEDELRSSAS